MQIFHWLLKVAHETERDNISSSASKENIDDQEPKQRDITVFNHHHQTHHHQRSKRARKNETKSKHFKPFAFLCRRDVAEACFYSTINLRRINSFNRRKQWDHPMKMKKQETVQGFGTSGTVDSSATHVGNKVLPITETALASSSSSNRHEQCGDLEMKNKAKGDKAKTISRMKELIKWAAAAKSEKGGKFLGRKVLNMGNRGTLKAIRDDDGEVRSGESPKISLRRWDVERISTASTSAISMASSPSSSASSSISTITFHHTLRRKGNWITTDSEFVVLEL